MLQTTDTHKPFEALAREYLERHSEIPRRWLQKRDIAGGRKDLVCWPGTGHEVFASLRRHQITVGAAGRHTDFEDFGRGLSDDELAREAFADFKKQLETTSEAATTLERCREALHADPVDHLARRRLAARLARLGRMREALLEATQLRLAGELTGELAYELGSILAERDRDHARALPWFEAAEALGHYNAPICQAHCLINLGRTREAFDLYASIARAGEAHPSVLLDSGLGMAKATFDMGDATRALTLARQALAFYAEAVRPEDVEHARQVIAWLESETAERP
jgi:tetratricopeptide (TPR) repeat protein